MQNTRWREGHLFVILSANGEYIKPASGSLGQFYITNLLMRLLIITRRICSHARLISPKTRWSSLLVICVPFLSNAQGSLLLTPQRVVFEGSKKIEELNLANTGKDTARYVISLIHLVMKEDGSFDMLPQGDSGLNPVDRWVRFFPHSVILGPNESQTVRIQLTRPNAMAQGEYRSHLYFRAIPPENPLGEKERSSDSSITVRLVPIFGISIPVIIRVGPSNTQVTVSDLSLDMVSDTVPSLKMAFHRNGNMSTFGDISVDYIPVDGRKIHAGTVRGIAVYTPNEVRRFRMPLAKVRGIDYHSGKLHIVYSAFHDLKTTTIAEADLVLH